MLKRYGTHTKPPIFLVHGGAGLYKDNQELLEWRKNTIAEIIAQVWPLLRDGASAVKTVCRVVELLEDLSHFNAGRGAVIQSDGMVRLSAFSHGRKQTEIFRGHACNAYNSPFEIGVCLAR